MSDQYIWISRWEDFQHYPPERDRPPAWIKMYTKQLDDDRYRRLTINQRALLHDLRITFAKAHGELTTDTRQLSHRVGYRVLTKQLESLSDAGFIQLMSRESLDLALESFYASRARDRAHHQEVEKEEEGQEQDLSPVQSPSRPTEPKHAHDAAARVNGQNGRTDELVKIGDIDWSQT